MPLRRTAAASSAAWAPEGAMWMNLAGTGGCMYAEMAATGSWNEPGLKDGLSAPSYSNLESISCSDTMLELSSGSPSGMERARKTGMKRSKGSCTSCHSPSAVSKDWQYVTVSQLRSVRRMNLYRWPSPRTRRRMPVYAARLSGGSMLSVRTLLKPPLLSVDTVPRNSAAGAPPSPAPSASSQRPRLQPPITTSSSGAQSMRSAGSDASNTACPSRQPSARAAAGSIALSTWGPPQLMADRTPLSMAAVGGELRSAATSSRPPPAAACRPLSCSLAAETSRTSPRTCFPSSSSRCTTRRPSGPAASATSTRGVPAVAGDPTTAFTASVACACSAVSELISRRGSTTTAATMSGRLGGGLKVVTVFTKRPKSHCCRPPSARTTDKPLAPVRVLPLRPPR
mmetsp:Transcript_15925/g.41290  ORF Transcript_15925/g.41290 Transcript_15925/m.41290 type:complete len:398 (-) Transcript_15925:357-1550(-)